MSFPRASRAVEDHQVTVSYEPDLRLWGEKAPGGEGAAETPGPRRHRRHFLLLVGPMSCCDSGSEVSEKPLVFRVHAVEAMGSAGQVAGTIALDVRIRLSFLLECLA